MKTFSALALGMLFSVFLAPQLQAAPQLGAGRQRTPDGGRVCLYQDNNYVGWEQCYNVGDEVRSLAGRKAQASSIKIFGRARVTVYDDTDFRGRTTEFTSDVPNLGLRAASGGHTWNDRIESLQVTSDSPRDYRGRDESDRRPDRINNGICVYDRRDFEGREQCWRAGEQIGDLARVGNWSDRISSIRVFGRATVVLYRDIGFRGESVVIDRDIPDLERLPARTFRNWYRQISSLTVETKRGGPFGNRTPSRF